MVKSKFKIGDSVRIINGNKTYSTYCNLFHKLGFKNTKLNKTLPYGIGKVFGIDVHEFDSNDILIAIRDEYGNECLINEIGLDYEFDMSTNEGRLAYARKYYPVGTKYRPIDSLGTLYDTSRISTYEPEKGNYDNNIHCGDGFIYVNLGKGKWAEIIKEERFNEPSISKLLDEANKKYPIGTKYRGVYAHDKQIHKVKFLARIWKSICGNQVGIEMGNSLVYDINTKIWAEPVIEDKQEEKVMETQKLSREGLKEIHSIACPNWKDVLEHYGTRNPLENYIELTQDEVDKMFKACTKEQLPIVSKYLKQDDGSVDLMDIKTDKYGMIINQKYILRVDDTDTDNKSFWLNNDFKWEIKLVNGFQRLIPTKKIK